MKKNVAIISLLWVFLSSCATRIREHHYFKDNLKELPNYYRVDVTASTRWFSKTRYYSGFFKTNAIDTYFNEFSQPENGKLIQTTDSTTIRPIAGDPDRQLVVILSSNADDIARQIGDVTQNKNTLRNLVSLTNAGKEESLALARDNKAIELALNKNLVSIGEGLLQDLESKDSVQVNSALLQLLNQLASDSGKATSFKTIKEAGDWFRTVGFPQIKN
jgi:hypothetical protein